MKLNVLTTEDPPGAVLLPFSVPCDGSYACPCKPCVAERGRRVRKPPRIPKQPWQGKAA